MSFSFAVVNPECMAHFSDQSLAERPSIPFFFDLVDIKGNHKALARSLTAYLMSTNKSEISLGSDEHKPRRQFSQWRASPSSELLPFRSFTTFDTGWWYDGVATGIGGVPHVLQLLVRGVSDFFHSVR